MDPDRELLERCREGDDAAFTDLVRRFEDMVYKLAHHMLRTKEEAEEAAQEVFLNVFRSIPFFRGGCSVKTWVYRIAAHECIARSKRRKRMITMVRPFGVGEEENVRGAGKTPGESLDDAEEARRVRAAIAGLPETYRTVIVLRYFDGLSYDEIADALEIPVNTLKVWLFRAKARLRDALMDAFNGSAE